MAFELKIDKRVQEDIEKALDYYFERSSSVANKLYLEIQDAYSTLTKNPFFQIRYIDFRCLPLKSFPYKFHFSINEEKNQVLIHALINTAKNPKKTWLRVKRKK